MHWVNGGSTVVAAVVVVVATALVGVPVAGAAAADGTATGTNEAPLAEAGLDRNVTANTTVYLDATGSRDPDGTVAEYRWRIERPDGGYTTPDCEHCGRTRFVPHDPGTYNVTVTVTDGNGATSTDTLRVHVDRSNGPTVTLTGPDSVVAGAVTEFSASVSAGPSALAAVVWRVDGHRQNRTTIAGDSAAAEYTHAFRRDGTVTVSVTAVDRLGRRRTATTNVTVTEPSAPDDGQSGTAEGSDESGGTASSSGESGDRGGDSSDGVICSRFNRTDDRYCTNDRTTLDSNGVVISDADNDGSITWAGVTIDAAFARNHAGVSYDSLDERVRFQSQQAYKEALNLDTVNVNPEAEVNQRPRLQGIFHPVETDSPTVFENIRDTGSSDQNSAFTSSSNEKDQSKSDNADKNDERNRIPDRIREVIQRRKNSGNSKISGIDRGYSEYEQTGRVPLSQHLGRI